MKYLILMMFLLISELCLAITFKPYFEADLPKSAVEFTQDEAGEFVEIIVNEWQDHVYIKGGNKNYIFQQGYDYSKKQGFIRTYSTDRKLINEKYSAEYDGMVSREELLQAFEIFKSNSEIIELLSTANEAITLQGGFNYTDKKETEACYAGNRCVHVFAATSKQFILAHAIVKLVDKSVPYPHYDMEQFKKKKNEVENEKD